MRNRQVDRGRGLGAAANAAMPNPHSRRRPRLL